MSDEREIQGWEVPLCRPLTRRVMFAGVPFFVGAGLVFASMQLVNFKAYQLLAGPVVAFLAARIVYSKDEWGVSTLLENIRSTIQRKNRMDV